MMKSRIQLLVFLILGLLVLNSTPAMSQIALKGGRGLFRLKDALPIQQNDLYISGFFSGYFVENERGSLAEDYHFSLNTAYGLADFLELSGRFVAYQDDQQHIWGPIGDTEISLKIRLPIGDKRIFHTGFFNTLILPTGVNHNLPYEPFTADHVGWSPGLALTIDLTDVIYFPLKLYTNAGYIDRNVSDDLFAAKIDQVLLGGGLKFSIKNVIFFWEYYTEQFINRPEVRFEENFQVSTQGIVFLGPSNIIFTLAGDVNLAKPEATTFFKQKDLANWKIWLGVTKYIPFGNYLTDLAERKRREKELQEELRKQQEIRKERAATQSEVNKLKELLKKQSKTKKKKKKNG